MKKHLLLLFTALLPLVASAEKVEIDGIWYNLVSMAKVAEVTFKGDDPYQGRWYSGSITIPATVTYEGVTYSVTSIAYFAFYNCDSLTAINIPESVTSIGERAFASCSSLTAINIPESVTSISERAFEDCSSLTAIIVAEGNIMYDSRNNCNAIIKTANNTLHIGCATTIIPEGVTSIGNFAFYKCNSLTSITIPKGVTSLEDFAFQYCTNLTSITLPEGLTTIDLAAISHCDSLKTITIPASVTKLGDYAFDYTGFTDVLIPENSQLESIGDYAFSYCNNLNSITIPSSVPRIGDRTFEGCN